jgi:uncharacterized protein DUF5946
MDSVCPGCKASFAAEEWPLPEGFNASRECFHAAGILTSWTQTLSDRAFVHQHVVDAYAAQHVTATAPSIRAAFALVGLHLACDRGLTGRQVQRAHMWLAKTRRDWPRFDAPAGEAMTVADVLAAPDRTAAIHRWAASVWACWQPDHLRVRQLVAAMDPSAPYR